MPRPPPPSPFPHRALYSVIVSAPLDGSLGAYSLSTLRLNRPCDGVQALSCSSVVDGAVNGLIRSQVYGLTASAGDSYLLRLLRPDAGSLFRPRLDIYDQGRKLRPLPQYHRPGARQFHRSRGRYLYRGRHRQLRQLAEWFVLALPVASQPSLRRRNAELRSASPRAVSPRSLASSMYSYTAAAGESFSVRMLPNSGTPQPAIEVYDGLGNQVGQPLSGNFAGVDVVKPPAGSYTVLATDSSTQPSRLQLHARSAAYRQRLLRACRAGRNGQRRSLLHRSVPGVSDRGLQRRHALPAQHFLHCQLRLPDGALRSRRRAPRFRCLQPLPQGRRLGQLHRDPRRRLAAHRGRIQLRLAAAESARRRIAARLRRFHHGRAVCLQSVPLLHARRQRRRHPAPALYPHQRKLLAAD